MSDNKKKKITIYDVAEAANVSPGTVSRYINGIGEPRGETKNRIEQAIRKLNYVPNRAARALKSNKRNLICLAYPESDNPFFFDMVEVVEKEARKEGYSLMIYHTHAKIEEELRILAMTQEGIMDGLILVNFNYTPAYFEAFSRISCPLVISSLSTSPYGGRESDTCDYVGINVKEGMYLCTKHMAEQGHKRIAYVGGPKEICVFGERYEGYCNALKEKDLELDPSICFLGEFSKTGGYKAGIRIAEMEEKPTAVCAVSDMVAIGLIEAFKEKGIRIPEDIALSGMDNIDYDIAFTPELTSVKMRQKEIGKCAVDCLLHRINGDSSAAKKIIYEPELVVRRSSCIIESMKGKQEELVR